MRLISAFISCILFITPLVPTSFGMQYTDQNEATATKRLFDLTCNLWNATIERQQRIPPNTSLSPLLPAVALLCLSANVVIHREICDGLRECMGNMGLYISRIFKTKDKNSIPAKSISIANKILLTRHYKVVFGRELLDIEFCNYAFREITNALQDNVTKLNKLKKSYPKLDAQHKYMESVLQLIKSARAKT